MVLPGKEAILAPADHPPLHLAAGLTRTAAYTAALIAHVGYDDFVLALGVQCLR